MNAAEEVPSESLARRRARGRRNQKNYRIRQKEKEELDKALTQDLKDRNYRSAMYLALLAQGTLLKPHRNGQLRGFVVELFTDYFQFGADPQEAKMFEKQDAFLSYNISPNFLQAPGSERGYKPVLKQWVMFTKLLNNFTLLPLKIEAIGPDQDIYVLHKMVTFTLSHRAIAAFYPHMLQDIDFMRKAVGALFHYPGFITFTFGSDNKIASIRHEQQLNEAWAGLLKSPSMLARLFNRERICHETNPDLVGHQ